MIEDEEGNEMVLAYLNKGQFFGEMGLFHEQPTRSAWVRTRNQCELAEMTYPRFRQIAAESPGLIFELATQLATRLDRTNRKLGDLAFVDVTGRVAQMGGGVMKDVADRLLGQFAERLAAEVAAGPGAGEAAPDAPPVDVPPVDLGRAAGAALAPRLVAPGLVVAAAAVLLALVVRRRDRDA